MRFFVLGTAISALAALAAAVPVDNDAGLTSEETKHMKGTIISLAKAIKPSNCDVAISQVTSLHNMLNDVTVEGYVDKEAVSFTRCCHQAVTTLTYTFRSSRMPSNT